MKLNPQFDDSIFEDGTPDGKLTPEEIKSHIQETARKSQPGYWFNLIDPFHAHVEPLEWISELFIAKGMITLIGGVAGAGKSILTQYLLQLRDRQDLITTRTGKAVYLTGMDSSETQIRRRAKSIGEGTGLFTVHIPDEIIPFITDEAFYNGLKVKIKEHDVDVIVFDTLADFHEGNLYEAADANATMSAFRRLADATGVSIVLITHIRKSADLKSRFSVHDIADSRIFATKSDFVFGIRSEYQNDSTNLIEIQCPKARSPKTPPDLRALVKYDESKVQLHIDRTDRPFAAEADEVEDQRRIQQRRERAWELFQKGETKRAIADELGVSHTTINNDLKEYEKTLQEVESGK